MKKIYVAILSMFLVYIFLVNTVSFLAGFNPEQLINLDNFKERTKASVYFIKNIALYTGFNIKLSPENDIDKCIKEVASQEKLDEAFLKSIVVTENEFSINLQGGMGLSSIPPAAFEKTGFKDPFIFEENIKAAAITIKTMIDAGKSYADIRNTFMIDHSDMAYRSLNGNNNLN